MLICQIQGRKRWYGKTGILPWLNSRGDECGMRSDCFRLPINTTKAACVGKSHAAFGNK